jgi:glycosyltransferase involved in cell wall biosynthesis
MDDFSIIICCYNSSGRIIKTLNYLNELLLPSGHFVEIILVDNQSTDNTRELALNYWNSLNSKFEFKVVFENKPGLSNARVAGILNSKFEYLVFCDDDNWLNEDYLLHVRDSFKNSMCKIVGGLGEPVSDLELPEWFYEYGQSAYAVGNYGRLEGPGFLSYGAGLAIRRQIALKYVNLKDRLFLSDRKGLTLSSGGDSELCLIVGLDHVFYNPNLRFSHYLGSRVTEDHFLKLNRSFGVAESYLFYYKINSLPWFKSLKFIFFKLFNSLKYVIFLKFKKNSTLLRRTKAVFHQSFFITLFFSMLKFHSYRKRAAFNINWVK